MCVCVCVAVDDFFLFLFSLFVALVCEVGGSMFWSRGHNCNFCFVALNIYKLIPLAGSSALRPVMTDCTFVTLFFVFFCSGFGSARLTMEGETIEPAEARRGDGAVRLQVSGPEHEHRVDERDASSVCEPRKVQPKYPRPLHADRPLHSDHHTGAAVR